MFKTHFKTPVKNEEELVKVITNYIGVYDDSSTFVKDLYKALSNISKELVEEGKDRYRTIHYPCDLEIELYQTKYGFTVQAMIKTITVNERGFDKQVFLSKSKSVNQSIIYDESDIPDEKVVYNLKGFPLLNNYLDGELVYLKHDIKHISHVALAEEM